MIFATVFCDDALSSGDAQGVCRNFDLVVWGTVCDDASDNSDGRLCAANMALGPP